MGAAKTVEIRIASVLPSNRLIIESSYSSIISSGMGKREKVHSTTNTEAMAKITMGNTLFTEKGTTLASFNSFFFRMAKNTQAKNRVIIAATTRSQLLLATANLKIPSISSVSVG